mgnify:CR=1 FL=1
MPKAGRGGHSNLRLKPEATHKMSITVHLSGYLKPFSGGETEIALVGDFATVGDVLDSLWQRHRALRDRVLT